MICEVRSTFLPLHQLCNLQQHSLKPSHQTPGLNLRVSSNRAEEDFAGCCGYFDAPVRRSTAWEFTSDHDAVEYLRYHSVGDTLLITVPEERELAM